MDLLALPLAGTANRDLVFVPLAVRPHRQTKCSESELRSQQIRNSPPISVRLAHLDPAIAPFSLPSVAGRLSSAAGSCHIIETFSQKKTELPLVAFVLQRRQGPIRH